MRSEQARVLVALVWSSAILPVTATAQTRFEWPDTVVDVARYTNVDDCLSATQRVRRSIERTELLTVWRDTMPRDPRDALAVAPAPVTAAAARCAARFTEPAVDLHDFGEFLTLFLAAGRDSDAAALVARRLAAVGSSNPRERVRVVDSAVSIYLDARPTRLAAAEALLVRRAQSGVSRIERLQTYDQVRQQSHAVGDTARARRAARWVVGVADSLTPAERQSEEFEALSNGGGGQILVYGALEELAGMPMLLDSLRQGTIALAALQRTMLSQASGQRAESLQLPTGQRAPVITADYWFPSDAGNTPLPRRGHASLVLFLAPSECLVRILYFIVDDNCAKQLALLRRLGHRFPTLDISVVASTRGFFMDTEPPAPASEAVLIRRLLDAYQVPRLVLSVSTTPVWRLPEPDRRRIDSLPPNVARYNQVPGLSVTSGTMVLIDAQGLIANELFRALNEDEFAQFVDVLLHRQSAGS